jgi:hypothetical protein
VKDPYAVLRQKERDVTRVRKEIRSLLTAIPLLEDGAPSWPEIRLQIEAFRDTQQECQEGLDADVDALERYYPFVSNRRTVR